MQYVRKKKAKKSGEIFADGEAGENPTITHKRYTLLTESLKENPVLLAVQISYYTGLRVGEVCGLAWQDINLEEQYMVIRRSAKYNCIRHKNELGTTKSNKARTVDFGNTLAGILKEAKKQQHRNRLKYGNLYRLNYFRTVTDKGREYHEVAAFLMDSDIPDEYQGITFVCIRSDGSFLSKAYVNNVCNRMAKKITGMNGFHFHMLRHRLATKLLENGIARPVISSIIGQTSPGSLDDYLSADFVHLKECAISIERYPVRREVFGI